MTRITGDALYRLLPAVHRLRDADEGEPLRALLAAMAREGAVIEENIEQLLDDAPRPPVPRSGRERRLVNRTGKRNSPSRDWSSLSSPAFSPRTAPADHCRSRPSPAQTLPAPSAGRTDGRSLAPPHRSEPVSLRCRCRPTPGSGVSSTARSSSSIITALVQEKSGRETNLAHRRAVRKASAERCGIQWTDQKIHVCLNQFSQERPSMRANSASLSVTMVQPRASA